MTHANLMNNYFNPNSVYTEEDFRRRFRMRRHVFERLLRDVQLWVSGHDRVIRLHALGLEELSYRMAIGFSGRSRKPIVVLEDVASDDTWIWHAFFGVPGSQNDITVLGRSPLFSRLTEGEVP
ncbi:uncharacterized protein [Pyrus communis]|uniref:uncharacterized protein n=1 Tax=Pyrus communis TaxID=23211 RepID=UPI0035C22F5B